MGREAGLVEVPDIGPNKLWPRWNEQDGMFANGLPGDDFVPGQVHNVFFRCSIGIVGVAHICHDIEENAPEAGWSNKVR